jgi:type III secretion protein N (ATPase)
MPDITERAHMSTSFRIRGLLSKYEEIELLLKLGEIKPGVDREIDLAVAAYQDILAFLKQDIKKAVTFDEAVAAMTAIAQKYS